MHRDTKACRLPGIVGMAPVSRSVSPGMRIKKQLCTFRGWNILFFKLSGPCPRCGNTAIRIRTSTERGGGALCWGMAGLPATLFERRIEKHRDRGSARSIDRLCFHICVNLALSLAACMRACEVCRIVYRVVSLGSSHRAMSKAIVGYA